MKRTEIPEGFAPAEPAPAKSRNYVDAFDEIAERYDCDFTFRSDVRTLRAAVWSQILEYVDPPERILDLGCGTGEDTLFLARRGFRVTGTDASPRMLKVAGEKLARNGCMAKLQVADHTELPQLGGAGEEEYDAILSDFGALNTIPELLPVRELVDRRLRPGGYLFLCLINRFYLRELLRGEFRRLRARKAIVRCGSQKVNLYYHSREALPWPGYRILKTIGLSVLLRDDVHYHWPLNALGDHFLVVMQKQSAGDQRSWRRRE